MNEQTQDWFDALTKDRSESPSMLKKPSMRDVQRSVVDKYSDQAHFIYELLKNADDVLATSAHFRHDMKGLFFKHNGPVRFMVSTPQIRSTIERFIVPHMLVADLGWLGSCAPPPGLKRSAWP